MPSFDARVDAYIAKSAAFARPILEQFRALVHQNCPTAEETIKWGMPFFVSHGKMLCSMAAFKEHCAIGFWHHAVQELIGRELGEAEEAMGHFGRITRWSDLPSKRDLARYLKTAAELAARGVPRQKTPRLPQPKIPRIPLELSAALAKNGAAQKTFDGFSPSHRREYIEWVAEAKRPETKAKRVATAIEWLRAGKSRNWKYERR